MKLFILIGLPGSGKSTYAEKMTEKGGEVEGAAVISSDEIRERLHIEKPFDIVKKNMLSCMKRHQDVMIDATNVTIKNRADYLESAKRYGYTTTAVVFLVPLDICRERNKRRESKAGLFSCCTTYMGITGEDSSDHILCEKRRFLVKY